jgi:hypothetical protein
MPKTYEPIATTTLGSAQATVTFSSISSNYTDLVVIAYARSTRASSNDIFRLGFNSDTSASNYSATYIASDTGGGTAYSGRYTSGSYYGPIFPGISGNSAGSSTYTPLLIHIMNYSNTTTNKTYIARGHYTSDTGATVGRWNSTSAISSLVVSAAFGNLDTGSIITLYGIKAA